MGKLIPKRFSGRSWSLLRETRPYLIVEEVEDPSLPGKKPQPGCRKWQRFGADGSSEVLECDKQVIMDRAGIPARDLRILGPLLSHSSVILARERAMVVNLEHVKAIITAEEVLVLNAGSRDTLPFIEQLRRNLPPPPVPQNSLVSDRGGRKTPPLASFLEHDHKHEDGHHPHHARQRRTSGDGAVASTDYSGRRPPSRLGSAKLSSAATTQSAETRLSSSGDGDGADGEGRHVADEGHGNGEEDGEWPTLRFPEAAAEGGMLKGEEDAMEDVLPGIVVDREGSPATKWGRRGALFQSQMKLDGMVAGGGDELPFEFRVLELALDGACSLLDEKSKELHADGHRAMEALTKEVSTDNLQIVRSLKSRMTRLTARVQKVRNELEQLLDDDDDMEDLCLTHKLHQGLDSPLGGGLGSPGGTTAITRWSSFSRRQSGSMRSAASRSTASTFEKNSDRVELEMLLEAYFRQVDTTITRLTRLREYIDDTEDYVNVELDNHRNQLLQAHIVIVITMFCFAVITGVTGAFSMNVGNFKQYEGEPSAIHMYNNQHAFYWLVFSACCAMIGVFAAVVGFSRYSRLIGV